jgi:hypothetical protein
MIRTEPMLQFTTNTAITQALGGGIPSPDLTPGLSNIF